LEWLDWCATTLAVDGLVFDVRHFPRVDGDYLAQIKKVATDLGVSVAAVRDDRLLDGGTLASIEIAQAIGAPIVLLQAGVASDDAGAAARLTEMAQVAAREAKKQNVTLAARAVAGTLLDDASALKRLAKDVDSSWLRFAIDPAQTSDPHDGIVTRSVIAAHESTELDAFGADVHADISSALRGLNAFRGFFALDYAGTGDIKTSVRTQLSWLRTLLAKETLEQGH
jgi:arginine utilization protein RocB